MDNLLLEINNLEVIYKLDFETVHAVNGISFRLFKGETIGIVGETGAGKTTTALSILRLLPENIGHVTAGRICFKGQHLMEINQKRMQNIRGRHISMIFQDPMTSLNPIMTLEKQIRESLVLHEYSGNSDKNLGERVDELLSMVGISPARKKDYPHQLSGGMKQRVVIAMSLACEPNILIADEPTTALDVTIQAQVISMMNNLRDRLGTAMILISHDLGIVAQTCDKVAVMYAGKFVEYGTVEDIFLAKTHHPYTVGLFGSLPSLNANVKRLSPIIGLMPDPTKLSPGCVFAPRCPKVMDVCWEQEPTEYLNGTHSVLCHLY